jgi:predicted RNA-binding Zn-ribbon protein involved in translation (DUF1610 family)
LFEFKYTIQTSFSDATNYFSEMNEFLCPRCGTPINALAHTCSCPACGETQVNQNATNTPQTPPPPELTAWDSLLSTNNPVFALADSLWESFSKPNRFFSKSTNCSSVVPPWLYALVTGSIGMLAAFIWSLLIRNPYYDLFSESIFIDTDTFSPGTLIAAPVIITLQLFISSAIIHFLLWLFRYNKTPFSGTFRLVCFSEGAMVLQVLPVAGSFLSLVFWIFFIFTGIHHTHKISIARTIMIFIIPFLIVVFLFLIAIIVGIIAGFFSSGLLNGILSN